MNHPIPTLLVWVLLCLADAATSAGAAWPPKHFQTLPPDYLRRMRASLVATTERGMEELDLKTAKSEDSILWVRAGIGALALGKRARDVNSFFESETFVFPMNDKYGFGLFSVDCLRLYGLFNNRTGLIPGILSAKAQENFERGMWQVAKANSLLAEAQGSILDYEDSENHHLTSRTGDLLAAQFLRKIPAYADQKYDDGSTLEQQYQARRAWFLAWFDERARHGQFIEAASPSYQNYTINTLFNLRDFAEDPVLRRKAEMFLDLAYANMAEETLLTTRGGPKSRVKTGHEYDQSMDDRGYSLLFDAPGRKFSPVDDNYRTTSNYYPPPAVVALARDTKQRGDYSFAKRWPGPLVALRDSVAAKIRTLEPQTTVLRYGFATLDFILGSSSVDASGTPGGASLINDLSMGFRWQGAIFAGDPLARIGFEVLPASDKDWHGFNPFFTVQDRNLFVTRRWAPVPPNPPESRPARLRVYFSPTLDEVREEDGWVFVRDGGAFAALKVVSGGCTWNPAWKHADTITNDNKSFLVLDSEDSPVILALNQAADYDGDFKAFQAAWKAQPVDYENGTLRFAAIEFHDPSRPGKIGGREVDLAPPLGYESPFIRSAWGSGLIHIRKGRDTLILDFRDPNNPVKTIGAPVSDAFPPGHGGEEPILPSKS